MPISDLGATVEGDRVYRAIKARAVACEFGPGEPIRLGTLAHQLGVSTTPIRTALNMLAAEGLVAREPQKGFIAMSMSENRFIGLYRLNRVLLDAALTLNDPSEDTKREAVSTFAGIGYDLDVAGESDADAIAEHTGRLFLTIAKLSPNAHVAATVGRINDSLRFLRTLECAHLCDVPSEVHRLCELFLANRYDALSRAIADYHSRRMTVLPKLLESLRA